MDRKASESTQDGRSAWEEQIAADRLFYRSRVTLLERALEEKKAESEHWQEEAQRYARAYNTVLQSKCWKLTAPLRSLGDAARGGEAAPAAAAAPTAAEPPFPEEDKALTETPPVSILIPNSGHYADLRICMESLLNQTSYTNYEILLLDNGDSGEEINAYYAALTENNLRVRVLRWEGSFNYSAINNFGAKQARGEYLILLNNDTEVVTPDWIEQLLRLARRSDVGIVGARLLYRDNTLQHAGMELVPEIGVVHSQRGEENCVAEREARFSHAARVFSVTGACVMLRRSVWEQLGGLDESFAITYNDVDLCMRLRQAGYAVVWTPRAVLYHYECRTRGYETTPERIERARDERERFEHRWAKELAAFKK